MKKLSTILIAFFALGACMLNPLTPPPPALDMNNPTDKAKVEELVTDITAAIGAFGGEAANIDIGADGTLKIPATTVPAEFKDMLPTDAEGNFVFDLHSIETVDGKQQIVYKTGDSYVAVVFDKVAGTLSLKNSPTIDFGTIDWDSEGIYTAKKP